MNLLITGENGFIGKNLVNVISLDNNFRIFYLSRYNNCIFPFLPEKIDFVIHLASVHRIIPEHLVYDENEKDPDHNRCTSTVHQTCTSDTYASMKSRAYRRPYMTAF